MKINSRTDNISFNTSYMPPGDKSISHRSIFFSALSENVVKIKNFLTSYDCSMTVDVFKGLGVRISQIGTLLEINGVGLGGLKKPNIALYAGNSGTTARLLIGLLAAQEFESAIKGDESLSQRPMKRILDPLRMMGASMEGREGGNFLPIAIKGQKLHAIEYCLPIASAQVKSALLIAGLYAEGETSIREPFKSRDHSERILRAFGVDICIEGLSVKVSKPKRIFACDINVPGDISSAAFFIALALLSNESRLIIKNVGLNPTRMGLINILKRMNAKIETIIRIKEEASEIYEPCGDIIVKSSVLKATEIRKDEIPLLIDELPLIFLLSSLSKGRTFIEGVSELRFKETDRINSMLVNLKNMGAEIEVLEDNVIINGVDALKAARFKSFSDHRTAMVSIIAAIIAGGKSHIDSTECINISYPGFLNDLKLILGSMIEFEN